MAILRIRNIVSLMQARFLKTYSTLYPISPLPTTSSSSFTVEYLVNSCGIPLKTALLTSKKLQLSQSDLHKPQALLDFLKAHDFNHAHIAKLFKNHPNLLHCRLESNVKPKFEFLTKNGFVGQLLPQVIVSNPEILKRSLESFIKPYFELLKPIFGSSEKIVDVLKCTPLLFSFASNSTLQQNIDLLIKEGMGVDRIAKLFVLKPRALHYRHERIVYVVNDLKNLGLQPKETKFIHAVSVMLSFSELAWLKKKKALKSLGWPEEDILLAFKRDPLFFLCSEEKMRVATDFFLNTVKLELRTLITCTQLFKFSLDKTIRPRFNVLKVLKSKKLIKDGSKIEWMLCLDKTRFLERYVTKNVDQVPGLLEIYGAPARKKG